MYQQHKLEKTRTGLTKEVVKNYCLEFGTLIASWEILGGEPVIAPLRGQIVFQSLINHCMLVLEIGIQGFSEALCRARALLAKPEGMFETDEYG